MLKMSDNLKKAMGNNYFRVPTEEDLDGPVLDDEQSIRKYLDEHVSGKKMYPRDESELDVEGGSMIVSFKELQDLVNSGCNIIKAEYLNKDMISIVYQKIVKIEGRKRR